VTKQKKLEADSKYNQLDLDGDGLDKHEKQDAQRRMAWIAMLSMLIFTALVFLPIFPDSRINALADLFSLFYLGMAGVVSAYFGAAAFISRGKK
jgi:hypothetical protein